jgi:hypothetical protein
MVRCQVLDSENACQVLIQERPGEPLVGQPVGL